jgi:beta-fructofuranosidase
MVDTLPRLVSRSVLAGDPHRPRYHFLPPSNWMNDPNGLIQWQGKFHLFYQYNPFAAIWGDIHWGHAVSDDLVHWRDLPIALAPSPGTVDEYGVFSGCAVDAHGVPTILYTGVRKPPDLPRIERPCLATSGDADLVNWDKYPGNPVIASLPPGLDLVGFRDHCVWHDNGTWYQAIGSGIRDVGGTVLLYRSRDLVHWEYVQPVLTGDRRETGEIWECPDLFALGDTHVLMVSPIPLRKALYFLGSFTDHRFQPRGRGVVDAGGYFYAPQSFSDALGRRVMFGWLWEGRDREAQVAAGWAGVMSLPRVLVPRSDGQLGMEPAPELESLRGRHTNRLDIRGSALEIIAEFAPSQADQFGLKVLRSPDGSEETLVGFEPRSGWLSIDRARSSRDRATDREPHGTSLRLSEGERLRLHIFVDHSVIEVFANGRACLTTRVYPSRADSVGVELFARGDQADLERLDCWEMASIWPEVDRPA